MCLFYILFFRSDSVQCSQLQWRKRIKIALDAAQGNYYLKQFNVEYIFYDLKFGYWFP